MTKLQHWSVVVAGDRQEPIHLHHEFTAVKSSDWLWEHTREQQYWNLLSWTYPFTFLLNASRYWYTFIFVCPAPLAVLDLISLLLGLEGVIGMPQTLKQDALLRRDPGDVLIRFAATVDLCTAC